MNILILSRWLPYPLTSGNPIRNYNFFQRAAKQHNIWLVCYADPELDKDSIRHLEDHVGHVTIIPDKDSHAFDQPLIMLKYFLTGTPVDLRLYQRKEAVEAIRELTSKIQFDLVQIEDSFLALHWNNLPPQLQSRAILTFHDVAFIKYKRMYPLETSLKRKMRVWLHSKMMFHWEPGFAEKFSVCITMSDVDKKILLSKNPKLNIKTLPNGVDTKSLGFLPLAPKKEKKILFVGNMSYRPNVDGAKLFIQSILPLIQQKIPNAELWLVGINPSVELLELSSPSVHITGRVDDIIPYYAQSEICVVPLRAGSGTRLKILESMALGRPVVSTTIGCEGLEIRNNEHLVIADEPVEFAEQIIDLLSNEERYNMISRNARTLVEEKYDWDVLAKELFTIYDQVNSSQSERKYRSDE